MIAGHDRSHLREVLRHGFPLVNDHPDVAGILRDASILASLGAALAEPFAESRVSVICAPEARGPIVGALVAVALGVGLVLLRKDDQNHPGADRMVTSAPTWRGQPEIFQGRSWDVTPDDRVLVVDDWITTGSSIRAVRTFVDDAGATYVGATVVVNKADAATIQDLDLAFLVQFSDIVSTYGPT